MYLDLTLQQVVLLIFTFGDSAVCVSSDVLYCLFQTKMVRVFILLFLCFIFYSNQFYGI